MRSIIMLVLGIVALNGTAYAGKSTQLQEKYAGVPILFSSDDWGTAIGGAGLIRHVGQPQMSLFGTGIYSSNGSWLSYLSLNNMMLPGLDQWLIDISAMESSFSETSYYVPGNPAFADHQPGTNSSSGDNHVRTSGRESRYYAHVKYILPIGQGREGAIGSLRRSDTGDHQTGRVWNPFQSGITSLEFQPFYERQALGREATPQGDEKTMGMRLTLDYDNRNSSQLPTRGSQLSFTLSHDWGDSHRAEWTTWEAEFSKFFNLGGNDYMRQQVIAFNAWLADTPSWNDATTIDGSDTYRRPPSFAGVSLGGWNKLRGYTTDRFYGRSAVSYSLEYRVMPHWQPLDDLPVIEGLYDIPWWQWTLFIDAGRVANTFSLEELHNDMKYSIGGGIRFKVEGVTVRTEIASSKENTQFRVFVNQPF